MTKVGEGGKVPEKPVRIKYHEIVDANAIKFKKALAEYPDAKGKEKVHFRKMMEQSLDMIRAAVTEIKTPGIQKQEAKIEKDYQTYMLDQTDDNRMLLMDDINTLRDYNDL